MFLAATWSLLESDSDRAPPAFNNQPNHDHHDNHALDRDNNHDDDCDDIYETNHHHRHYHQYHQHQHLHNCQLLTLTFTDTEERKCWEQGELEQILKSSVEKSELICFL